MPFKLVERFGWRLPFALGWYFARFVRQKFWFCFFKTFGRYGFSKIGRGVRIDGLPSFIVPCCPISLGDCVRIGKRCVFQGDPSGPIEVGNNVTINDGCFLTALYGIQIGDNTSIGEYTSIRDYNHKFSDPNIDVKMQGYTGAPISIGKGVWIGRGCVVLAGTTIGDGAIIGANSLVNSSIPAGAIAVGAPARVVKNRKDP